MATAQANAAERLDQLLVEVGAGPMVGELIGGDSRFVFSTSGHIAAIVNPSSNPKAGYRVGDEKRRTERIWSRCRKHRLHSRPKQPSRGSIC